MNPRSAVLALAAIIVAPSIASSIAWAGEIELPWIKQKTATECARAVLASVGGAPRRQRDDVLPAIAGTA